MNSSPTQDQAAAIAGPSVASPAPAPAPSKNSSAQRLWELSSDIVSLEEAIVEIQESEDLSDEQKEVRIESIFTDWLNASDKFDEKAIAVASYIRQQEAIANARKAEAQRLKALQAQSENKVKSLKSYLQREMERSGKTKIEGVNGKLSLRKSPGVVKLSIPEEDVPPDYCKVTVTPAIADIKKDIKLGKIDWAEIVDNGYSLVIK
jgi:hypothetical protein